MDVRGNLQQEGNIRVESNLVGVELQEVRTDPEDSQFIHSSCQYYRDEIVLKQRSLSEQVAMGSKGGRVRRLSTIWSNHWGRSQLEKKGRDFSRDRTLRHSCCTTAIIEAMSPKGFCAVCAVNRKLGLNCSTRCWMFDILSGGREALALSELRSAPIWVMTSVGSRVDFSTLI